MGEFLDSITLFLLWKLVEGTGPGTLHAIVSGSGFGSSSLFSDKYSPTWLVLSFQ